MEHQPGAEQPGEEQPGATVRRLMAAARQATLATALARDGSGRPYASLVLVAPAPDSSPILLLSDLADHSRNLAREPRAALLFDGTAGLDDPLTGPRASILGQVRPVPDRAEVGGLKAIFLARHPGAAVYADFADFRVYRMAVESAHLVAGFGTLHWLTAAEIFGSPDPRAAP
jgi:heme oxygenase (biliverdin-IX-beta and delta-forming)